MSLLHFVLINFFLVGFYAVYSLLEKGRSHFMFNRIYLIVAPIACFILPFVFEGASKTPIWIKVLPLTEILQENSILKTYSVFDWKDVIFYIGLIMSLLFMLIQLYKIFRKSKKSFYKNYRGTKVYLLMDKEESYSFFNNIYLSANIGNSEEMILLHEFAHCKGRHSFDVIYLSVLRGLLWFNPIAYKWLGKAKENHEFMADNYVLQQGVNAQEYGTTLLTNVFNVQSPVISNSFNSKSTIRKRLEKFNHKNKYNMKQLILVPVLVGMTFVSMSLNEKQLTTQKVEQISEVDQEASFPGGEDSFYDFIASNFNYPKSSLENNSEGVVYVQFTVGSDGNLFDFEAVKSLKDKVLNEAALTLLKKMPNWIPAKKDGKNVKSIMILPISFKLN